jgi:phosphatidyl-myo-inositol dimannoside synthase
MPSLLVTNDFPPKLGGIQSYLYELWRRLPPEETTVLTTPYAGAGDWDAAQQFRVERTRERVLFPTRGLARRIESLALEVGAQVVFLDPTLPLGLLGPKLRAAPYVVIVHGAEVTVPGRLPLSNRVARRVLRGARGIVAAGEYPAREAQRAAGRALPVLVVPPGVDPDRFRPLPPEARVRVRRTFGLADETPVVLGLSRLVPRKGFDVLIDAVAGLTMPVQLVIGGDGRDRGRLERAVTRLGIADRTRFLGRVPDESLPNLYACSDVFAMLCHDRWGGLEAEGFGVVFLEAAASGVAAVAGRSGGSHEAVVDGVTGLVVEARNPFAVRSAIHRLLGDQDVRRSMGDAARSRVLTELNYDRLVERLLPLTRGDLAVLDARH